MSRIDDNYSEIQNNESNFQNYKVNFSENGEIKLRRNLQNNSADEILSFDEIRGYSWKPVVKTKTALLPAPNANQNSTKQLLNFSNKQSQKNSVKTAVKPVVNSIITGAVKKISDEQERKKLELQKQSNNQKRKNALNSSKSVMSGIVKSVGEKLAKQISSSSQDIDNAITSSKSVMSGINNTPQIQQVVPNNKDNWNITWNSKSTIEPNSSQKSSEFTPNLSQIPKEPQKIFINTTDAPIFELKIDKNKISFKDPKIRNDFYPIEKYRNGLYRAEITDSNGIKYKFTINLEKNSVVKEIITTNKKEKYALKQSSNGKYWSWNKNNTGINQKNLTRTEAAPEVFEANWSQFPQQPNSWGKSNESSTSKNWSIENLNEITPIPVLNWEKNAVDQEQEAKNYNVNLNKNLNKEFNNPNIIGKIHNQYSSWINTLPKNTNEYTQEQKNILRKYEKFSKKYPILEYSNFLTPLNINTLNKNAIIRKFQSSINKINTTKDKIDLNALNTQINSNWEIIKERKIQNNNNLSLLRKYSNAKTKLDEKRRGPGPEIKAHINNNNFQSQPEQQQPQSKKSILSKVVNFFSSINPLGKK
jgi:hypothetical protein